MRRPILMILTAVLILSGCNDSPTGTTEQLLGTWDLISVNGEQLPYQNPTPTYSVRSGSVTFFEDFRYEKVRTIEGWNVRDAQTETGSFEFDGERITMTQDATGLDYSGTATKGRVTLRPGHPSLQGVVPKYRYEK